jgi:hypothetical protein
MLLSADTRLRHLHCGSVALSISLSLVAGSWASASPPAATEAVVLMLPLEVEGELSDQARASLLTQMRAGLEHPAISVLESAAAECSDDACLREFGRASNADYVISTRVSAGGRNYELELRTLPVFGERSATTTKIDCAVCGIAEVSDRLAVKARVMRDWVLADTEPATLSIEGSPASAVISIDGELVGTLPFSGELRPGDHEIIVSAPKYVSRQLPHSAVGGSAMRLVVDLVPVPEIGTEPPVDGHPPAKHAWRLPVSGAAIGLGVVALATGATFLALDGRPIGSKCSDPANLDAEGDCKFMYTSLPAGIGLAVGGVVLAGVGIGLLAVELRQRRTGSTAARLGVGVGLDRATLRVDF